MKSLKKPSLRKINNVLSLIVVALAIYILVWPLLPEIRWRLGHVSKQSSPTQLTAQVNALKPKSIPTDNTLVIPRIDASLLIYEGQNNTVLEKGAWRRPKTSTPESGGNTVIVGHRFNYSATGTFYYLDKVQVGDPILLYWQGKEYKYRVSSSLVVPATQTSVEDNTKESQLTLYTCTPIWSFKDRLVVIAKPWQEEM